MISMETYIALLFMVIPGFVARGIYQRLNHNIREKTDFETTISALIYSVFVICITFFILFCVNIFQVSNILTLKEKFEEPLFILTYAILTFFVSVGVAFLWDFICPLTQHFVNWYRKKRKRNAVFDCESLWDSIFDDGKQHIVSVEIDGIDKGKGTLIGLGASDDGKIEFQIRNQDKIKFIEDNGITLNLKYTYFDLKNKVIVKEYDLLKMH